jgi:S-DNA-T family DNA segregation ATPase FtsK/SpoIIIE
MPRTLSVRDVRDALAKAASPGDGAPSARLLGRWFHEIFAEMVRSDSPRNLQAALRDAPVTPGERRRAAIAHAYEGAVGPRLRCHQAQLHHLSAEVLDYWRAVQELVGWLAELPALDDRVATEAALCCTLREPGWTDAVELRGAADAVLRRPDGRWCVVELKLGRNAPEADLAQALLYQWMIARTHEGSPPGELALVRFEPERRERMLAAADLESARRPLLALIGRLAGVRPSAVNGPGVPAPIAAPTPSDPTHQALGRRLVEALAEHGVSVTLDGPPVVGPAFLRFPLVPATGVKLAAIEARAREVQLRLGLEQAPRFALAGHRVAVDVQRPDRQLVPFDAVRAQLPKADPLRGGSRLPIGIDLDGRLAMADLSRPEHAHLLVAGTTGSGKTEWLRASLAGLLLANTPETLRLVLIDPKRNAFAWLRESPFLLRPVAYPDEAPASGVLAELVEVMEERYRQFVETEADDLAAHVARIGRPMPRIVCVCDEYADLIRSDRDERKAIEQQIVRLGAKARAAGIHLILATQQPSREVLRGALDANIPARVGLQMTSAIESRMLLSQAGAETLLGRGDLLFKDFGDPVRLQAPYLEPDERAALVRCAATARA